MTEWVLYIVFFIGSAGFCTLLNRILLRFSSNLGVRERHRPAIRWTNGFKPSLGGISFYIAFLLSFIFYAVFVDPEAAFRNIQALGVLSAASLAFLMGLADDAYNTRPFLKLSVQVLCGLVLFWSGSRIQLFDAAFLNGLITVIWTIGVMNSVNMLDNMDGVTGSVAFVIVLTGVVFSLLFGKAPSIFFVLMVGALASILAFLVYNWYPSRMFMGDTGSQFLGVFLAAIGINYFWGLPSMEMLTRGWQEVVLTVFLVFLLPIVDTTVVVLRRVFEKRSPFIGGRDHTTHHLSYLGLSDRKVALVFGGLSLVSCSLALTYIGLGAHRTSFVGSGFILGYLILVFGVFFWMVFGKNGYHVPSGETEESI